MTRRVSSPQGGAPHVVAPPRGAGRSWIRAGLLVLALGNGIPAIWAAAFPRSFYDRFPGDHPGWAALFPPYNEHLVRDFGAALLPFAVLALWAVGWPHPRMVAAACVASLAFSVPHLIFHQTHHVMSHSATAQVISQVAPIVIALAALAVNAARRRSAVLE